MKRRTYGVVILLYIVTLGLFWWMWQSTRPDRVASSTASAQGTAKPAAASASVKKTTLTFITVSTPDADNGTQAPVAVAEAAPAAPAPADPPVQHSALITVPLAQAEHHLFSGSQGPGVADNFSIMGVFDSPNGSEVVDVYVWEDGNGHGGRMMSFLASALNSEDQAYVNSWVQQQQQAAAASNSTTPQLTPDAFLREATELGGGNITEELNQRIANGEYGSGKIYAWLNALARSAAEPTDPESTSPSAPQPGPRVGAGVGPPSIASPQN